uniref:dolichol kinase n=1 Tax=Trichobilharzia regenti TaxID=157069 RepID=A0AA85JX92_TRIRE|nr:unnamed protein product [Trichobilharzia regenti]
MLADDRYRQLMSVSRKHVGYGLWLGLIVPSLLLKTGHKSLSLEFFISPLITIFLLKTNNSRLIIIPLCLWVGCSNYTSVITVIRPLFTNLFIFSFFCELLSLFPFSFSFGEALLLAQLCAVFIITECNFLIPFLMLYLIERYSVSFSLKNASLMAFILSIFSGCCWFSFCRTQIPSSFIVDQIYQCFISSTNFSLLMFWLGLFSFCVYVTIVSRQSNTLCQTANISEFYDCPPPLSSQESDFSDQSEYFEVCNEDSSSSSSSGCDTTLSLSIDSAKRFKVRKLFHFAAGLVYTSGLLYSPHLLSLASVCLLIVFWCFEWIRRRGPYRLSSYFSALVDPFRDERDSGEILFTPIALLLGLSIPIWWPENLKTTDITVSINHLCYEMRVQPTSWTGILSIAIGDSFAALIGKAYGKRCWPGSHRTFLGSSASFLSQIIAWTGLSYYYSWSWKSGVIPLLCGVVVEAYTEQIDNLVVPLVVMFSFLFANTNYTSFVYNIIS